METVNRLQREAYNNLYFKEGLIMERLEGIIYLAIIAFMFGSGTG